MRGRRVTIPDPLGKKSLRRIQRQSLAHTHTVHTFFAVLARVTISGYMIHNGLEPPLPQNKQTTTKGISFSNYVTTAPDKIRL